MYDEKPTRRIVGYTRRSQERVNGFGLEAQADAITRWATYERAEVVEIVADDATYLWRCRSHGARGA
jgi:hypothetical protein